MYALVRPALFSLDAETAHDIVKSLGEIAQRIPFLPTLLRWNYSVDDPRLHMQLFGQTFENPVGVAAGFDKNARLIDFTWALGFGFTEVGSVTDYCVGNPRPRLFRLPLDEAIVNRMGLNSEGWAEILPRLKREVPFPVGVNITKTNDPSLYSADAIIDFARTYRMIHAHGTYVALNVSCPNTRDGTTFEDPGALDELLSALDLVDTTKPCLLKLSPDLSFDQMEAIHRVAERRGIQGYVCGNTSVQRDGLETPSSIVTSIGKGGLSGRPLLIKSLRTVRFLYSLSGGKMPIVGCGGIRTPEGAYLMMRNGASLLELYTAMVYHGPSIAHDINSGLLDIMAAEGIPNVAALVGVDCR